MESPHPLRIIVVFPLQEDPQPIPYKEPELQKSYPVGDYNGMIPVSASEHWVQFRDNFLQAAVVMPPDYIPDFLTDSLHSSVGRPQPTGLVHLRIPLPGGAQPKVDPQKVKTVLSCNDPGFPFNVNPSRPNICETFSSTCLPSFHSRMTRSSAHLTNVPGIRRHGERLALAGGRCTASASMTMRNLFVVRDRTKTHCLQARGKVFFSYDNRTTGT